MPKENQPQDHFSRHYFIRRRLPNNTPLLYLTRLPINASALHKKCKRTTAQKPFFQVFPGLADIRTYNADSPKPTKNAQTI